MWGGGTSYNCSILFTLRLISPCVTLCFTCLSDYLNRFYLFHILMVSSYFDMDINHPEKSTFDPAFAAFITNSTVLPDHDRRQSPTKGFLSVVLVPLRRLSRHPCPSCCRCSKLWLLLLLLQLSLLLFLRCARVGTIHLRVLQLLLLPSLRPALLRVGRREASIHRG